MLSSGLEWATSAATYPLVHLLSVSFSRSSSIVGENFYFLRSRAFFFRFDGFPLDIFTLQGFAGTRGRLV